MAIIPPPLNRLPLLSIAALLWAASAPASYAESQPSAPAPLPPTNAMVTISTEETAPAVQSASMTGAEATSIGWADLKDYTSERRVEFLAGLQRLEARVKAQINELTARRATLKATLPAKDLDHALNELSNAQFAMKTLRELLGRATPQTWEQTKAKVGLVWTKSQAAYAKAQARTTS